MKIFSIPPKFIRRAAPVEPPTVPQGLTSSFAKKDSNAESASSSSLERNIKPSEILRQKSSDSLDIKLAAAHRKTTPDLGKHTSELADEFGRKLIKAESFDKNRRPDAGEFFFLILVNIFEAVFNTTKNFYI